MKNKLLVSALLALTSLGALAQAPSSNGITYTDQHIILDMGVLCYSKGAAQSCDLNSLGIGLKLTGSGSKNDYAPFQYMRQTVTSSIPIVRVTTKCGTYCGTWNGNILSGEYGNGKDREFPAPGLSDFVIQTSSYQTIDKIYLSTGIPSFLRESFTNAGQILKSSYTGVLRNVTTFRTEIAKSHRGHLERFMQALTDGIALIDAKDSQGKLLYSVMDWRVQENSRLVVVFGTVLNELLTDYDDVERLKVSIQSMRTLVDQLRLTYGWQRGLAGTVSKASSSLIDVVRLELQELASIKMAMGSGDFTVYMDLLRITRTLQAKVDASRSGDMKAQREIFELLDKWNDKPWQDELNRLMNAGPDFKNLVIPKLSMLIYAMESIADLSEMEFLIPDRAALK